jgi:hypothetical protein
MGGLPDGGVLPPGRGTPRCGAVAHTAGVTTFDTATVKPSLLEQSSRDLLVVTAQLIEAACRAKDGDSDGTRAHIARAVALLDGRPGLKVTRQTRDRGSRQIPRGGFAAWQSRRLAAHVDANLAGRIVIKDLRRIVGETPSSWRQTRHGAIEERVTELAYPGTTKPTFIGGA